MILLFLVAAIGIAKGQEILDFKSQYDFVSDTVTNTGTAYLGTVSLKRMPVVTTTVLVAVTKISGTVGGVITLQGSLDGTVWQALNTPNTATALATFTASNGSANYHWVITGSPFKYYRVSWTGTGTMAASFTAKLFRTF